jgi:hypothetical protein
MHPFHKPLVPNVAHSSVSCAAFVVWYAHMFLAFREHFCRVSFAHSSIYRVAFLALHLYDTPSLQCSLKSNSKASHVNYVARETPLDHRRTVMYQHFGL